MNENATASWYFIGDDGAFRLEAPHRSSYLYFPLVNEAGMMSVVTPALHGDTKTGQNTFLTLPVSVEDLHNTRSARNFWVTIAGQDPWSATGNSAPQIARVFTQQDEAVALEAGLLWQRVTRDSGRSGLRAEVLSFVPAGPDAVELMRVTLTNTGKEPYTITPTAAIPIFGRSADNLRDHRHVTSLLHRVRTVRHGVLAHPTLSFDERGHRPNTVTYAVLGAEGEGAPPVGFFPVLEDFIGEGGNLEWPQAVVKPDTPSQPAGFAVDGYEAIAALRFAEMPLAPGEARTYVLILAVLAGGEDDRAAAALVQRYGSAALAAAWLERTQAHWQERLATPAFRTGDARYDGWVKWVAVQPILRRLFGNSFLPYHDYGRGGRGWRDLWQDCLALLVMDPEPVRDLLLSSFGGVRIDGSNATIIGGQPGEFIADRNNIPRVWMDHGAWPYLTTRFYLDQSGDLAFLLQEQTYFKDRHIDRCRAGDDAWSPEQGTALCTDTGEVYRGTILEHLLIQHLTAFFHAGAAGNNILLEGADWNDGMDMARERGESVAFTALYASNLRDLSSLVLSLARLDITEIELAAELVRLLDTLNHPVEYEDSGMKRRRLAEYFASCRHTVSGAKVRISLADLARDLAAKADWLTLHIRVQEWVTDAAGYGWFNGYYDDNGRRVEGDHPNGVRMTLTGQVFTLMGGSATDAQAAEIVRATDRYLYDPRVGGCRLNTDFGGMQFNLGRCFGFAFGHKENGAMFSHMAVMYANALYRRGLVCEGHKVLAGIYQHCQDFAISRMYPGLPEYISERGRGMYPWLTGSASWYLLTLLAEVFGVKGDLGDLVLAPKLVAAQFDPDGDATVRTQFAGRDLEIVYHNPRRLDWGDYSILSVDSGDLPAAVEGRAIRIARASIVNLPQGTRHRVAVTIGGSLP
jgi:cellobiose phosphorylase